MTFNWFENERQNPSVLSATKVIQASQVQLDPDIWQYSNFVPEFRLWTFSQLVLPIYYWHFIINICIFIIS